MIYRKKMSEFQYHFIYIFQKLNTPLTSTAMLVFIYVDKHLLTLVVIVYNVYMLIPIPTKVYSTTVYISVGISTSN